MTSANKGISVTINEHSIESVSAQKHLGITIDKNLIWEQQIDLACRNVSRKLTFMKLLSKYVNQNSLKQYYNSYLLPMLDFGCVVWGNITNANLTIPIKLQKKKLYRTSSRIYLLIAHVCLWTPWEANQVNSSRFTAHSQITFSLLYI